MKVEPLTQDFVEHNEKQRNWVKGHFTDHTDDKYASIDGKLRLLDTIISQKWIEPTEKWKLQALGITFGDALVQKLGMEWVTVTDEYGRDPAVCFPGTTLIAYPLTVISKRIEDGEQIDIFKLFEGFSDRLLDLRAKSWT